MFGIILTVILIAYVAYYIGMIIHDLFFDEKGIVKEETVEEEEIDISEEAQEFVPVNIIKDEERKEYNNTENEEETEIMNGAIEVDELLATINEGELSNLTDKWNEKEAAA